MDEDLERLLSNPFEAPAGAAAPQVAPKHEELDHESRLAADYSIFDAPVENVLGEHLLAAADIEARILSDSANAKLQSLVEPSRSRFRVNIEELRRAYNSYVETAKADMLAREAERLKRRYFQEDALPEQIEFIKLKRFYEKIRTFNEFAKKDWRELQKLIDALSVMTETGSPVSIVATKTVPPVLLLLRQTEAFLDALRDYLGTEEETLDPVTGGHRIVASYTPEKRYTIRAFFGLETVRERGPKPQREETPEEVSKRAEEARSPRSLILDGPSGERKGAAVYKTALLGSRDWNRTPAYSLQMPAVFIDQAVANFNSAYQVNLEPGQATGTMSAAAAIIRKGEGLKQLDSYVSLMLEQLDRCADAIINEDFPGLEKPEVFLYHCGPQVMYTILLGQIRKLGVGDIFYMDQHGNPIQELPEELIRKTLIEWWNTRFRDLNPEDVDSYLTYSRAIEMIKKHYRALYEEGAALRREEQPGASYVGFEKWIRQNRVRVFGARKIEIFRRFLTGTVLHNQ